MAFDVGGSKRGGVRPSMNVTPLVDVVLVLLIIFMVVTPLMTKQLFMDVPEKPRDAQAEPPQGALPPVVLTLDAAGRLAINREPVTADEAVPRLVRMLNARPDKVVFFDAADDVPYGRALEVMDRIKGGGVPMLAVLPERVTGAAAP